MSGEAPIAIVSAFRRTDGVLYGWATAIGHPADDDQIILIAPNSHALYEACSRYAPSVAIDPTRFREVGIARDSRFQALKREKAELLEALERITALTCDYTWPERYHSEVRKTCEAAIAKAKGGE